MTFLKLPYRFIEYIWRTHVHPVQDFEPSEQQYAIWLIQDKNKDVVLGFTEEEKADDMASILDEFSETGKEHEVIQALLLGPQKSLVKKERQIDW